MCLVEADRDSVGLRPGAYETDVADFSDALRASEGATDVATCSAHLARAVELYRGALLSGFYDDWIFAEQQRQEHRFLDAIRRLLELQHGAGRPEQALETALRGAAADPLSEELQLEVMRLQILLGRPAAALRQYRELERKLHEELGIQPSASFHALVREARAAAGDRPDLLAGTPAEESLPGGVTANSAPAMVIDEPEEPAAIAVPEPDEPSLGAVPLGSPWYVVRRADGEVSTLLKRKSALVLLKGSRQIGKTSLLGRALQEARAAGARVVFTDFQALSAADLHSAGTLFRSLAQEIADQLDLDANPADSFGPERSPAVNLSRFLRRAALDTDTPPLVWGLDEVDRLFACDFQSEVFGLFRSWYNRRVLEPDGNWSRLTQIISYATEAHLFIADVHQSPFNVGTQVELSDFTREQVADLNRRYGEPLSRSEELDAFYALTSGHPYLVQRGLSFASRWTRAGEGSAWTALDRAAGSAEGPYADHLRRIVQLLSREPSLCNSILEVLQGGGCASVDNFYRLRSSGILAGPSSEEARPRCGLYAQILRKRLH